MARIPDEFLECVVYVYPSAEAARGAHAAGGTGFLITVPLAGVDYSLRYIVTNSHVAANGRAIRVNTHDDNHDVVPIHQADWIHHPAGDDLALAPIALSPDRHRYKALPTSYFLTRHEMIDLNVGPGDDVYFMGRFIAHDGRQRNQPVVRFGTIAMMPGEPVYQKQRAFHQESFLVEARSLSGFSGSPVMLYIPPLSNRFIGGRHAGAPEGCAMSTTTALLGVDWGTMRLGDEALTTTGIMAVVPVWKLEELLEGDEAQQTQRDALEALRANRQ
jgi:hypothetical protein